MEVEVKKDGKIYGIEFSKGKTVRPLYVKGECDAKDTGTSVHFWLMTRSLRKRSTAMKR